MTFDEEALAWRLNDVFTFFVVVCLGCDLAGDVSIRVAEIN
jgi:hypothetical protein